MKSKIIEGEIPWKSGENEGVYLVTTVIEGPDFIFPFLSDRIKELIKREYGARVSVRASGGTQE